VLEFGVGTGRLALPLAQQGLKVYGMDNSEAMLERLRAKPGADGIVAILGDFASSRVEAEAPFSLVFSAFSTLFLLGTQEAQVECFMNAARHLRTGGYFVVEGFIHDRSRWQQLQEVVTTRIAENSVALRVGQLDPVNQIIRTQHLDFSSDGIAFRPNRLRFIYPSEMDLMARLAGLTLRERWGSWSKASFTADSGTQIGVYEKVSN
jgi:SAM-dependent methyltransferase